MPPGFYEEATTKALGFLEENSADPRRILDDPLLFATYHQSLIDFGSRRKKSQDVQAARKILDFIEVAKLFRVIDEAGQGVVVRYGEADALLTTIHAKRHVISTKSDCFSHLR